MEATFSTFGKSSPFLAIFVVILVLVLGDFGDLGTDDIEPVFFLARKAALFLLADAATIALIFSNSSFANFGSSIHFGLGP